MMSAAMEKGSMVVRPAEHTDAAQLAALNLLFNESTVSMQQIADYLSDCPCREKTVVTEIDGELVGFACLQIYRSWCYPDPWAELTELYVKPEYRQQGFGRAMVSLLESVARDARATEIILLTGQHNIAGQALYRSCGYVEQAKCAFRKKLQTDG